MRAQIDTVSPAFAGRATQKEATRQRVLEAARDLFDSHGYQGATIRDIARNAGVAVGSVFTTFASKGEILSEVMQGRIEPLYAELGRVAPHLRGPTVDRLRTMFAIHIQFETPQVRLFLSHIAAAYDWTQSPAARPYGHNVRLKGFLRDILVQGVESGGLRADIDLDHLMDLIMAAYAWTFRLAITEGADAQAMIAAMDRQLGLIVDGAAVRA